MAGNGAARSAGVAYIDLAVGDTKSLVAGISELVRQAADQAQKELTRGFDVSGKTGSFQAIVDAATEAAKEAGSSISRSLSDSAGASASALGESITEAVSEAASAASGQLEFIMGEAGREAGQQLAFNFEEASASNLQLSFFDAEDLAAQAAEAGRKAAESLARAFEESAASIKGPDLATLLGSDVAHAADLSTASIGSTFGTLGIQAYAADARDSISGAFRSAADSGRESLHELGSGFDEFKQGITYSVGSWGLGFMIGGAITTGVSAAFDAAKSAVIDFNSEMQSAQISFGTLLGSDTQATGMLNQLKQFTLGTPFMFEDITQGAQKLLALGINAQDVIPDLRGLGDAVSALGGDGNTLNSVVNVFGEMQSKGQIMEVQIRELQIRGIPALQILANKYGVSTGEMQKMIKAGKVMADDALPKLIDGMEKGTKSTQAMGGEMLRQSGTFKGSVSNLKDGLTQFTAAAFKPAFDSLNSLTSRMANYASGGQLEKFVAPVAAAVGKGMKDVGDFVSQLFTYIAPVGNIIKDLVDDFLRFSIVVNVMKLIGPLVLIVAQAIGAIGKNKVAAEVIAGIAEAFLVWEGVLYAFNIAMAITDALMDANPIGLLAAGIAIAVIGFVALYQHSKTFRDIVADIGTVASAVWSVIVTAFNWAKGILVEGFDYVKTHLYVLFAAGPLGAAIFFTVEIIKHFSVLKDGVMSAIRLIGSGISWLWNGVLQPGGHLVSSIVSGIGAVFVWLWREVIEPVVNGIWFALRLLFVVVTTLVVTPFLIAYHLLKPVVMALWTELIKPTFDFIGHGATWLWKSALDPAFKFIANIFTSGALSSAVRWLWKEVFEPAFHGISQAATWLYDNGIKPLGHLVSEVFSGIGTAANWLWKNVLDPAFHGIGTVFNWLYQWVVLPWWDAMKATFQGIADVATWLWKNILDPVFTAIGKGATWLYQNAVKPSFDFFVAGLKDVGHWVSWLHENVVMPVFNKIGSVIGDVLSGIKSGFKTAVDGISDLWGGLVDILRAPVNFLVNTVYTNGIREVWNFIADKVSIPELPEAPHFAQGGIIGGPASAGDWIPFYGTAGEGVLTLGEMEALGGPAGFNALRAMLGGQSSESKDGHYKDGGVLSSIWGGLKSVGGSIADGVGSLEGYASRVVSGGLQAVAKDMLKPVLNGLGSILPGDSILKQMLVGVPNTLIDQVLGWFGGQDTKANATATAGMPGNVAGWITQAEGLAGVGPEWTVDLAKIISAESGGNPNAINLTDSNAQAGDPSRGLMQTIMSTFEAYRLASLPDDIFNPVANIVAGIRYILSTYGTISNVPGIKAMASGGSYVGYATGTDHATPGWRVVGENGPELMPFRGGETVLSHKDSMTALSRISSSSLGSYPALSAPQMPAPIVHVQAFLDGKAIDAKIDVKVESNNLALARLLNGGRS